MIKPHLWFPQRFRARHRQSIGPRVRRSGQNAVHYRDGSGLAWPGFGL